MTYILSDKIRKAFRRHRCDQCGGTIEAGQFYRMQVNTYDGFGVYKAHEDCDLAAQRYTELNGVLHEEHVPLYNITRKDKPWIETEFPSVAKRFFAR
jgi:hypothetical protein